ncbi:hypothetical protein A2313_02265 [Candidatus Roizmanbacteria bacterium RIFOXYB2_FULL_41_10]|uniref:Uncharacterized protein n=1 Tax=Candidatus Roizmanbacteria bacterium RIFOXYA1_FULL_41_12 TaxID=1802082 RepID=A0A1F7KAS5_9BACT|nr:MAG: hypothetical protein A2209_04685 [Candidatus Roizmanbacteria bacterium RIFOXYA1_FULL_41_12]OGK66779.1 MAG: hypothetical protein A2377_02640 [Candidatus Roizmanbacteria bacterium RIFOXYB1_FULL_41_27]OGK70846.1 MAG: hypothetical protein A2403_02065 [Candidatus Roizmanbacteria bacterium RIFOXYC1_FULL_41_16]OGK71907.1 MAG: hypothetical protein A2313_02265 [Candidatus Roizmanbacteria bacterium RIFOXYB2_FULL_41_10]OGK72580.1 MAG: hypothetical protein A2459_02825 [Candidatus Roizmanbacteria ba
MVDIVPENSAPAPAEKVKINTLKIEIAPPVGEASPINPNNGQLVTDEVQPSTNHEQVLSREAFMQERGFVGGFISELLDKAKFTKANSKDEQVQLEDALTALKIKLTQTEQPVVITQQERAILEKLVLNYPPVGSDQLLGQLTQTRSNIMTLVSNYFGEQTGPILENPQQTEIKITETDTLQKAAQELGLLTSEAGPIDQDHWLTQLMSEAYRGLLSPEEMAGFLQGLSPEGRLIVTARDLRPESAFWQSFLSGQVGEAAEAKADSANQDSKKIGKVIGEWAQGKKALRLLLEEKLEAKKKKIMVKARVDFQDKGDQAVIIKAQEEIHQLEKDFYGLDKADKLNIRAQNFLSNLSLFYQQLPSQEPVAQSAWFDLINGEGDTKKTLLALFSALKIQDIDGELTSIMASTLERHVAKGLKLGGAIGAFALIFVLMQLYTGAMSGEGSSGQ